MIITIYKTDSGDIQQSVVGPEEYVLAQVGSDEAYIEGYFDARLYRIEAGVAVALDVVDDLATKARERRDIELARSDWTQVTDAPVDQQAWRDYRQALRDIPQQAGFPSNIVWPEKP